jgi:hypothetical protein
LLGPVFFRRAQRFPANSLGTREKWRFQWKHMRRCGKIWGNYGKMMEIMG